MLAFIRPRLLSAAALLLVLTMGAATGRSQVRLQAGPVGDVRQAGPEVLFEALFDDPVRLGAPYLDLVTDPPQALSVVSEDPMGSNMEFTVTSHRAIAPAGLNIGGSVGGDNDWTIEFLMKSNLFGGGSDAARCAISYAAATPGSTNELLFNIGGQLFFRGSVATVGPDAIAGRWRHVTITGEQIGSSTRIFLYYDGVFQGSTVRSGSLSPGGYFVLGEDQDTVGGGFQSSQAFFGQMDEVRIWDVVLSPQEVAANAFRTVDPAAPGLVHYWNFDETLDLGEGSSGTNDVPDLVGSTNFSLENGLSASATGTPSRHFTVSANVSALSNETTLRLSVAGTLSSLTGPAVTLADDSILADLVVNPQDAVLLPSSAPLEPTRGPDLVRTLTFDQTIVGLTPSDLTLTSALLPGTTIASVSTGFGQALDLDGGGFFGLALDPDFELPPGDFTVECWFQAASSASAIFSFASDTPNAFLLIANGEVIVDNAIVMPAIDLGQDDGRWHHLRVTVASDRVARYIDGVFTGEVLNTTMTSNRTGYLVLGNDQDSFGSQFSNAQKLDGPMDELRIHSTANPSVDWNEPADLTTPDLWSFYRFEVFEDLGLLGGATDDISDLVGGRHLDTANSSIAAGPDRGAEWHVVFDLPSPQTNFVSADLTGDPKDEFGRSALIDLSEPTISNIHVEDLTMTISVAGSEPSFDHATSVAGEELLFRLNPLEGTFVGTGVPVILAQFIPTGTEPGSVFGFPELRLDLGQPIITVFDGAAGGFFGPTVMPSAGQIFAAPNPGGLTGTSIVVQGLVLDGANAFNGIFAAANALVVDL